MNTAFAHKRRLFSQISRRAFLKSAGATAVLASSVAAITPRLRAAPALAAVPATPPRPRETYDTHAEGVRILPGQWRPHYPWEHIVWISPSWPSQDYLWLDFPEAIFCNQGLLYLSHVNPAFPVVFPELPKVEWRRSAQGVAFDRRLPNGVEFGGGVTKKGELGVELELHLKNGSPQPLTDITLQTCAFLRAIKEFADFTRENKFVHVPAKGWVKLSAAAMLATGAGPYRVGWRRSGKLLADRPVVATTSNQAERLVAMTWGKDTLSLVSNPNHPCMHADPQFKDLAPGESASINGRIVFFEGKLADLDFERLGGV